MFRNKYILAFLLTICSISTFCFFWFQNITKGDFNPKNIVFVISSNQNEYLKGEYIWITTKIINNSDQSYYVKGNLAIGSALEFTIKNSMGQIVTKPSFNFFYIDNEDSLLFQPNDTLENIQNLGWYRIGEGNLPNKYSIIAKFNNFTSNEILFKVREPEGDERKVYDFIQSYDKERVFKKELGQHLDNEAMDLLTQFPNSHYAPIIYEQLLSMFAAYYPDSNYFDTYFDKFMRGYFESPNWYYHSYL